MKPIFIFLVTSFITISAIAQVSTVTINVRGNKTQQVVVDGKTYTVTSNNTNVNANNPIIITDLQTGQHSLQVVRFDEDNASNTTTFNLRSGYDMQITILANGSVQLRESRLSNNTGTQYRTPMSDENFEVLYRNVNNQWRSSSRVKLLTDAFANASNYFTAAQARQLIQLVSGQTDRLTLAKASYRSIVDPTSFYLLNDLLITQASRDELQSYVSTYNNTNTSSSTAMSSTNFNTIYRAAQRQSTMNAKVNYIASAFTNTNNYFTSTQARQLIQLVSGESNRLYLAKASYRSIVDRSNFSQVSILLNSTASRNELTAFVNSYDGETTVNTGNAMSDAEFNTIYNRIRGTWGIGAKMSELTEVFNNTAYYFTVAQAKQLIPLVSNETNRLKLAKLSYDNIVDRGNFTQVYDVLTSQASRNELAAYVNSYSSNR